MSPARRGPAGSLSLMPGRPVLAEHCWICAKYAQCSCSDCAAEPAGVPVTAPLSFTTGFAQVVGGGVIKIPAQPVKEAT